MKMLLSSFNGVARQMSKAKSLNKLIYQGLRIEKMIVPWKELEPDTLDQVLEHFVLREGSDYGEQECSLEQKKQDVLRQLENGSAVMLYSELHNSVNIVPKNQLRAAAPPPAAASEPAMSADEALTEARRILKDV